MTLAPLALVTDTPAPDAEQTDLPTGPLAGEVVLVTGDIPGLSRDGVKRAVTALGGKPVSAPSGKVTLVVAGIGAGVSKMDKVRIHGCAIVTESHFQALLTDTDAWSSDPRMTHPEWVAHVDALTGGSETDEPRVPRPGDPDYVPMAQRHLVGIATDSIRIGQRRLSRLRCGCQCGHKWAAPFQGGVIPVCPVGTGDLAEPIRLAPWSLPGGGWDVFEVDLDVTSEDEAPDEADGGPDNAPEPVADALPAPEPAPLVAVVDTVADPQVARLDEPDDAFLHGWHDDTEATDHAEDHSGGDWALDMAATWDDAHTEQSQDVPGVRSVHLLVGLVDSATEDLLLDTRGVAHRHEIVDDLDPAPRF